MRQILLFLATVSLTGCQFALCTWSWGYKQLTEQPSKERLVGQYKLNDSSREYLSNEGFAKSEFELELFDNGKFKFLNGPDLIFDTSGKSKLQLIDREGEWSVSCGDSYDCLIELEEICVVPLCEKDGRLALLFTIGDGDECKGIVYEKAE